jgi:hypothetical protein
MRFPFGLAGAAIVALLVAAIALLHPDESSLQAAQPQPSALPADLALVPSDAIAFLHVRGAELWKNEVFAGVRAIFEKAGPKALAALDSQFVPKPSTLDRLTVFALLDGANKEPLPFGIVRFSVPFEVAEVVTAYLPKASAEKIAGKTIYRGEQAPFELYFPDHQHIVVAMPGQFAKYFAHESPKMGPMSVGLKLAASGKPIVASVNIAGIPPNPLSALVELDPHIKPLLKAEHLTASIDLASKATLEVLAGYKSDVEAKEAESAIAILAELLRKGLSGQKAAIEKSIFEPKAKGFRPGAELPEAVFEIFTLGAINQLDELLAHPEALVKRTGTNLVATFELPKEIFITSASAVAVGVGLLLPAVQKVRSAAARAQSQNNMKQIALACFNYESAYGCLPHDIKDKNGKPLLSWRVAILPFIEQTNLFNQFKLDEPWDSTNNKKWSEVAVKTFMSPYADPVTPPGMTHYKGFAGPDTVFEPGKKINFAGIPDGTSNTILVVEAGDPIPWAKPGDIPFDPNKPLPKLALQGGLPDCINVAMCDCSVRLVNFRLTSEKTMRNAITRSDGMPLGKDW